MRNEIVEKAIEYIGYTEGANNDTIFGNWYGLPNQPWCAMFVSYCADQVGISQDIIKKFASCTAGFNWFNSQGRATREHIIPNEGDIIFFIWSNPNEPTPDHVGLVQKVENGKVYTIEGNRSDKVQQYEYNINDWHIYGYALPNYGDNQEPQKQPEVYPLIKKGSNGEYVREAQNKLIAKGYSLPKYGADGSFGTETENAVKELQRDSGIAVDGIIGNDTWSVLNSDFTKPINTYPGYLIQRGQQSEDVREVQNRLIEKGYSVGSTGADGIFGQNTYSAVVQFQKDFGLLVDGIVGEQTWTTLFN